MALSNFWISIKGFVLCNYSQKGIKDMILGWISQKLVQKQNVLDGDLQ